MKVLICGGRDFMLVRRAWAYLDALHPKTPFTLVITGVDTLKREGADAMGDQWAATRGIDRVAFPANWTGRGKPAGPCRNSMMLRVGQPELVIAFPGGRGTADMTKKADDAGIQVLRPLPASPSTANKGDR